MDPHPAENGPPETWAMDWSAPGISWKLFGWGLGLTVALSVIVLATGYVVERVIHIQDMRGAGFFCIFVAFLITGLIFVWLENYLKKKNVKQNEIFLITNFINFKEDFRIYLWIMTVTLISAGLILAGRKLLALDADWIGADVGLLVAAGFGGIRLLCLTLPVRSNSS